MHSEKLYTITEVATEAGVSTSTLRRWLREGAIPEPGRNRNSWRVWTRQELTNVIEKAGSYDPPPESRQARLFENDGKREVI